MNSSSVEETKCWDTNVIVGNWILNFSSRPNTPRALLFAPSSQTFFRSYSPSSSLFEQFSCCHRFVSRWNSGRLLLCLLRIFSLLCLFDLYCANKCKRMRESRATLVTNSNFTNVSWTFMDTSPLFDCLLYQIFFCFLRKSCKNVFLGVCYPKV